VKRRILLLALVSAVPLLSWAAASPKPATDLGLLDRLTDGEFNHGQVVEAAEFLADRIGGRMTNSPAMRRAEAWSLEKFKEAGIENAHREGFEFGRGWWIESSHVRMVEPRPLELRAIPIAWTPPTNGVLKAPIVVAPIKSEKDLAAWKGKLNGKIVLVSWPAPPEDDTKAPFERLSDADLQKLNEYEQPVFDPEAQERFVERFILLATQIDSFLANEGALAWVRMSRGGNHLVHGEGYSYQSGRTPKLPAIDLAAEDYRRLARLAKGGEVQLEIESRVHYDDTDVSAYNVLAEIPGRDAKSGYVMAGAHLDSWIAGDGAADNGAGAAVVLEAARLLASLHVQPKRTLRFALWAGEEQGLLGSAAYVEKHLAHRPPSSDPQLVPLGAYFNWLGYPIQMLPEAASLAAYFNIDNGSGKVRGIYTEGNTAVVPIFHEWLTPLASMGAATVVSQPTSGTDHELLERLGLPAFQFIQDPLDYHSRVHHTDVDTFDHLRPQDLRQAVVVMAAIMMDAANAESPLPRKPLPTQPGLTDPFQYPDPADH
jgi:carboxypeptidase Q